MPRDRITTRQLMSPFQTVIDVALLHKIHPLVYKNALFKRNFTNIRPACVALKQTDIWRFQSLHFRIGKTKNPSDRFGYKSTECGHICAYSAFDGWL